MTTNTTNTLTRANKLTVKVLSDGTMQADFYRTHKHLLTVNSADTSWTPDPNQNKTLQREMFRLWCQTSADLWGINWDPADRRDENNVRPTSYLTDKDVLDDAFQMVEMDIERMISKIPEELKAHLSDHKLTIDSIAPKYRTAKGTVLSTMGIEDGKYVNNGKWAWADIEGTVTFETTTKDAAQEIYVTLNLELVSGQLKKFRMTQTQFNDTIKVALQELGFDVDSKKEKEAKAKAEKSAKAETQATSETATEAETPKTTKKTTRKSRSSKKVEKVEG